MTLLNRGVARREGSHRAQHASTVGFPQRQDPEDDMLLKPLILCCMRGCLVWP